MRWIVLTMHSREHISLLIINHCCYEFYQSLKVISNNNDYSLNGLKSSANSLLSAQHGFCSLQCFITQLLYAYKYWVSYSIECSRFSALSSPFGYSTKKVIFGKLMIFFHHLFSRFLTMQNWCNITFFYHLFTSFVNCSQKVMKKKSRTQKQNHLLNHLF